MRGLCRVATDLACRIRPARLTGHGSGMDHPDGYAAYCRMQRLKQLEEALTWAALIGLPLSLILFGVLIGALIF